MSDTKAGGQQKKLKLHWLKRPEKIPKKLRNLDQKINDSKHQIIYQFQIFWQKVSKPTKTSKEDHSFYNTASLKKPHIFYKTQYYYSRDIAKKLTHYTNFPANMFPVGVRKNICTAPFLEAQELHSQSKCFYILVNDCKKFLFQRRRKTLSGGWLNNFLKATRCLGLVKCFNIFHFICNFGNSTIFQHFDTSINSMETLKLSRQFGLQG